MYRLGMIHNSFNKFDIFHIPIQNLFRFCSAGLNWCLIWLKWILCNSWRDASFLFSLYYHESVISLMIVRCLEKWGWSGETIHCLLVVFYLNSIKKGHHSSLKWQHPLSSICFGKVSVQINICYVYTFWQISYVSNPSPLALYVVLLNPHGELWKRMAISSM